MEGGSPDHGLLQICHGGPRLATGGSSGILAHEYTRTCPTGSPGDMLSEFHTRYRHGFASHETQVYTIDATVKFDIWRFRWLYALPVKRVWIHAL